MILIFKEIFATISIGSLMAHAALKRLFEKALERLMLSYLIRSFHFFIGAVKTNYEVLIFHGFVFTLHEHVKVLIDSAKRNHFF